MDIDTLSKIEAVGSRLEKERLLATVGPETVRFLKWALDPMVTFGVTADQDEALDIFASNRTSSQATIYGEREDWWKDLNVVLKELSQRKVTGNEALRVVDDMYSSAHSKADVIWACRILNKDLRCGVQVSTLNKVFPGTIEPFVCQLANPYDPDKHELRGSWVVEPKFDGLRMVVIDGVAYTRNGRTIESVEHILDELMPFSDDYVFDGEVMGAVDFDEDSGKIRRKGEGPNLELRYNAFDCVRRKEWFARKTRVLRERKSDLLETSCLLSGGYVSAVDHVLVEDSSPAKLFEARDRFISLGYEGAMAKDLDAPYIFKRSDSVLKIKKMIDADGRIVSMYEGRGRHKGRLGGVCVDVDGVVTDVGSGFSDDERNRLWKEDPTGKTIEVQYQNKSKKTGRMRFPVFVKFRPDKD